MWVAHDLICSPQEIKFLGHLSWRRKIVVYHEGGIHAPFKKFMIVYIQGESCISQRSGQVGLIVSIEYSSITLPRACVVLARDMIHVL